MDIIIKIKTIIFIILSCSLLLALPANTLCMTAEDINKLKKQGLSDKEIRNILNQNKKDRKLKRFDAINTLKNKVLFIEIGERSNDYRCYKYSIKILNDHISQESEWFHYVYTKDRYNLKSNFYFNKVKSIEIIPYTKTDSELPGALSIFANTRRLAYYLKIKTKRLKFIDIYIKKPFCYDRYKAEKVKSALNTLKY